MDYISIIIVASAYWLMMFGIFFLLVITPLGYIQDIPEILDKIIMWLFLILYFYGGILATRAAKINTFEKFSFFKALREAQSRINFNIKMCLFNLPIIGPLLITDLINKENKNPNEENSE